MTDQEQLGDHVPEPSDDADDQGPKNDPIPERPNAEPGDEQGGEPTP